jgi:hypothetical protein
VFHLSLWDTHNLEEVCEDAMTSSDGTSNRLSLLREDQTTILFMPDESFGIESFHHIRHAGLRDAETAGDINDPGIALGVDEFLDTLQVVFDSGR